MEWDERARGPRMSKTVGHTIWKYQMPVAEKFIMALPKDAEVIRVEDQGGMFWLWAIVDTEAPIEERTFYGVKTGAPMPDTKGELTYHGWCAIHVQQELALYIFEETPHD